MLCFHLAAGASTIGLLIVLALILFDSLCLLVIQFSISSIRFNSIQYVMKHELKENQMVNIVLSAQKSTMPNNFLVLEATAALVRQQVHSCTSDNKGKLIIIQSVAGVGPFAEAKHKNA